MGRSKESKHEYLIKLANDVHVSEMNRLVFRNNRSSTDQTSIFRTNFEQQFSLQSFVDYKEKKAYEILNRTTLWNILQHYGIAENIINKIRLAYEPSTYHVHYRIIQYTDRSATRLHTLPKSLLMAVDWVMKQSVLEVYSGLF